MKSHHVVAALVTLALVAGAIAVWENSTDSSLYDSLTGNTAD